MKILLIYISPGKTTEKISRLLADRFTRDGHQVALLNIGRSGSRSFREVGAGIFNGVDLIGVGSPVFHMRAFEPLEAFLEEALPHAAGHIHAFLYLTYGGITTGRAFLNLSRLLEKHGVPLIGAFKVWAPHFFNPAQYPDPAAAQTVEDFCRRASDNRFRAIEWDQVRPVFSNQSRKARMIYPFTELIGRLRQLPIHFDREKCSGCGRCVNECPAGALRLDGIPVRDRDNCLYCYRCTVVCPRKAVICATEKVERMMESNKKILGEEQPRNAVFF
jgi:ferredoxin/flavodoxin